ncbi:hypothetical protein RQP46_001933 [Phenoliferia psychrophenolica]
MLGYTLVASSERALASPLLPAPVALTRRPIPRNSRPVLSLFAILTLIFLLTWIYIRNLSPYTVALFLEAVVPCRVHLQAKCFSDKRDWEPGELRRDG